jgi:O-antigen/teichoic acid export membrane protein
LQAAAGVALAANRAVSRLYPDLLYLLADAGVRLIAIPLMVFGGADVREVAALHAAASLIALPFAFIPLHRFIGGTEVSSSHAPLRLREFGGLIAGQTIGSAIWAAARRTDTLAVAAFAGPAAAGGYRIALLVASIGAVLQSAAQPILIPISTRDFITGGGQALIRRFRLVTRLTVLISAPVFAICLAIRRELLEVFGQAGGGIEAALVILCFGFALDCAAGPGTSVLVVSGRSWRATANIAVAFAAEVALLVALVPPFGAVGAAVSLGLAFTVVEALQLWSIRRNVGRPLTDVALGRSVSLAALLTVVGFGMGAKPVSWSTVVALCVVLGCYGWSALRFAVSREEFLAAAGARPSAATQ